MAIVECFSYIFFRVDSLSHGFAFISRVCKSDWNFPDFEGRLLALQIIILIVFLLFVEYAQRNYDFTLDLSRFRSKSVRLVVYISLVLLIIIYWPSKEQVFVYFQF